MSANDVRMGTSAFTAAGCATAFYSAALKAADYLTYSATKFDTGFRGIKYSTHLPL